MTAHEQRKVIRAELQAARCHDRDHSPERYQTDNEELSRRLTAPVLPALPDWLKVTP